MDYQRLIFPSREVIRAFIRYLSKPTPESYFTRSGAITVSARVLAKSLRKELFTNAWAEVRSSRKGGPSTWGYPQQVYPVLGLEGTRNGSSYQSQQKLKL